MLRSFLEMAEVPVCVAAAFKEPCTFKLAKASYFNGSYADKPI